jgi:hypothetical protein
MTTNPARREGYSALGCAVIEQAMRDMAKVPGRAGEAARWMEGDRGRVSFSIACDLAGLDTDAVRGKLRRDGRLPAERGA